MSSETLKDKWGRDVQLTQGDAGWAYSGQGMQITFSARDDARALEQIGQANAPAPSPAPTPSPNAVPQSVPRLKARKALAFAGIFAQVQPAIDAIPDSVQRALAQVLWEDSPTFDRNDPVLIQLAQNMGLSDAAVDSLFIQANALPD